MKPRDLALRLRQERALWRSAQLRRDVAQHAQVLAGPLAQVDRLRGAVSWLRRHPVLLTALVAAAVALTPRKALSKLGALWSLWCSLQRFRR
jgi:hypothetical protein